MAMTERRIRQIIREEIEEISDLTPANKVLSDIKKICDVELMNKSLALKGPAHKTVEAVADKLRELVGDLADVNVSIAKRPRPLGGTPEAVEVFKWISGFCSQYSKLDQDDMGSRAMCAKMICRALSKLYNYKVEIDESGLPEPTPGGKLGADLSDDE